MKGSFAGTRSIMKVALLFIFILPLADFFSFKMGRVEFLTLCIEIGTESFLLIAIRTIWITRLMNRVVAWKL